MIDFSKLIKGKLLQTKSKQSEIITLSHKLQKALKMSDSEVSHMSESEASIVIGPYRIVNENRCFKLWVDVLEIIPSDCTSVGWSNRKDPEFNEAFWHYVPNGTCTEILPPADVIEYVLSHLDDAEINFGGKA